MDHLTERLNSQLAAILRKKYQKVKDAYAKKVLLPPKFCYRGMKTGYPLPTLHQNEFRYIDNSDLHTWVVFPTVPLSDILSCECQHGSSKRTVITLGVSGVGKTTAVQTCALDWAQSKYNNIHLLFPLTFWELNVLFDKVSFLQLLNMFYPELRDIDISCLNKKGVWFVLDGLDEFCHRLNFKCPVVRSVLEETKVEYLVTNLIRGNLLPNAHVWITTRLSAATQIPECYLLKETGLKGFSDKQKQQNIENIIANEELAYKAVNHMRISRSLDFLCQIPVISTIVANIFKKHVKEDEQKIIPLNLTQIYSKMIEGADPVVLGKLKEMALIQMGEKNLLYDDILIQAGIVSEEASAFSKQFPLVLTEEEGIRNTRVFRFSQASMLEFFAAMAKMDIIEVFPSKTDIFQGLVDHATGSRDGQYDMYLRFIFGLSKERGTFEPSDPLFDYTKNKMLEGILTYQAVGLFHCLREYDSQALLSEVKFFLKFGFSPIQGYTPMHWTFMIQRTTNFEGMRDEFEIKLEFRSDEYMLRSMPVVYKSKKAKLGFSNLTVKSCPAIAAVLSTSESYLRCLDLCYNNIGDSGVEILVEGLSDERCRLKSLKLRACGVTSVACKHLTKALKQSKKLVDMDLSNNEIGNEGLQHLANGLRSPECRLESLRLSQCNIEHTGCISLASALQKNGGHIKVLDLSINLIGDKGANELFKKVDITRMTKLELGYCGITALSCRKIGEALKSESSSLLELNLSNNSLEDTGFAFICEGMYAWCSLEKLKCGITTAGCGYLAKVLCSVSQLYSGLMQKSDWQAVELKELNLSLNCLEDGVKEISLGMKNPFSHLKKLNLSNCALTDDCCADLAVGLASKENVIIEIDLSSNDLHDKGVKKLCIGIKSPHCKLEKLSLRSCGLTSKSVQFLITALKSNPQYMAELLLLGNNLDEPSIRVLTELVKNQKYTLHTTDIPSD